MPAGCHAEYPRAPERRTGSGKGRDGRQAVTVSSKLYLPRSQLPSCRSSRIATSGRAQWSRMSRGPSQSKHSRAEAELHSPRPWVPMKIGLAQRTQDMAENKLPAPWVTPPNPTSDPGLPFTRRFRAASSRSPPGPAPAYTPPSGCPPDASPHNQSPPRSCSP